MTPQITPPGGRAGSGWLALSDRARFLRDAVPLTIARGAFVLEYDEPLATAQVLLSAAEGASALSVFADPGQGIGLLLRQAGGVRRFWLPGPQRAAQGTGRIVFRWAGDSGQWNLRHERHDLNIARHTGGTGAPGLPAALIRAACAEGQRHGSVLWFGVTDSEVPPPALPWIGPQTPVATPFGPRPASALQAGEFVLDAEDAPRLLRRVWRVDLPSRGGYAPILLRAPYFGLTDDLLVSASQHLKFEGTLVDYLFNEDAVLLAARDLADGVMAVRDQRRAVTTAIALDVGPQAVLQGPGIGFLSAAPGDFASQPPHRLLARYEGTTLAARMRRRGAPRIA